MVYSDGEQGNDRSKTSERGNVLKLGTSSGGAPRTECDLPELCTNHMHRMSQTSAVQRIENPSNSPSGRRLVGGTSGSFTVTDRLSRKPHLCISQFPQLEELQMEINVINDYECRIERYNINTAPEDFDPNSTSNIVTPTTQKERRFKATLSPDSVKHSNQAAFQC